MGEIGSEFWSVPVASTETLLFPKSTMWFLSGRSALLSIIQDLKDCHTVAMPSWCCDSMIKPFVDNGFDVRFYSALFDCSFHQDPRIDCDVLFLMDYFGYSSYSKKVSDYAGIIIRDVTHSVFSSDFTDADYYFGSLRKWCGVWTGGYAWTSDGHKLNIDSADNSTYVS